MNNGEKKDDNNNDLENESVAIVKKMFEQYKNSPNMKHKINHYIKDILPGVCENATQQQKQREDRKNTLEEKSDQFIEEFLAKTHFFYHSSTELFFTYTDEKSYEIIKEDNIQHLVLTTITSKYRELMPWKYKIKIQLMKRIKENNVLKSIPESETIQDIIQLLVPSLFTTKDSAKYFLTVIGDILHKKNSLYYFINSKTLVSFFKDLNQECYKFFGINLLSHFKFKYYEHANDECRLINMCEISPSSSLSHFFGSRHIIDLFCVASHYSTRYLCGDSYLEKYCNDYSIINYALYLKNNSSINIVSRFINATTEECPGYNISWKNMMYLWKLFIEDEKIPNVFFNYSLKQMLLTNSSELGIMIECDSNASSGSSGYNAHFDANNINAIENVVIKNRTSKHLPFVCSFISYWENNINCYYNYKMSDQPFSLEEENENENEEEEEEYELEIDELLMLFNKSIKKSATTLLHNNVSDKMLLGLIRHFYPDVIIEDDKYLIQVGIKPEIWNKRREIEEFNEYYKKVKSQTMSSLSSSSLSLVTSQSLYSIYQSYCKYAFDKGYNIISKRWFEKYFTSKYDLFLIDNTIISSKWFQI
jgi:hypothetical protein